MNRNFTAATTAAILSVASLALASTAALAHDVALDGSIELDDASGYISTGDGMALRTGGGECLRMGGWSEENQNNACEGIEEEAEVEEVAEVEEAGAETESVAAPEPVAKEPIVTTVALGGEALFDTGASDLSASSEQALADLLVQLESYQEISMIEVTGHSDARGDEDMNMALSQKRAESVKAFLESAYPNVNITASGLGENSPIATNSSPEGRQLNRRVEVQVSAKSITEQ